MCEPALLMMAAGTAMQYMSQQQAARRAQRALGMVEDRNDQFNRQIIDITENNARQYDPAARSAATERATDAAVVSLTEYLNRARDAGMGEVAPASQGRVSEAFDTERARRAAAQADSAVRLAQLMGRVRGPMDLRAEEGMNNADAASRIGLIGQEQLALARAGMTDVAAAGRPDPFLGIVGSGLQGYGAGKMIAGSTSGTGAKVAESPYGPVYKGRRGPYIPRSLFEG